MLYIDHFTLNIPDTTKPRVIIIGGGFAGMNLIKNLSGKDFQIVLFDRQNYNGFWPLLYQVATAGLEPDAIAEPMRKMFTGKEDFHFRLVRTTGVNLATKTVSTLIGDLTYDYLVIATGTKSNFFGNEMIKQYAFPLKRMRHALDLRSHLLQVFEQANMINDAALHQSFLNIVIAGGGPTGVEVAGALAEMRKYILPCDYKGIDFEKMNIYLVEGNDRLLPAMSPQSSSWTMRYLQKKGILVKVSTRVKSYDGKLVTLGNGDEIPAQTLIWAAGVTGELLNGLPAGSLERSRILVDEFNQVKGLSNVFAIGDIALMKTAEYPNGHPGVAQPAIQMGKHLAQNLTRRLRKKSFLPFQYFNKGSLAVIGRNGAVGDLPGNIHLTGFLAWMTYLFVHIFYLIGFRNKLVVLSNWIYRFFTYQRGNRLIIRPYVHKEDKAGQEFVDRYLE
ncbi:NADH dehydrogenase [Niastella yeongjuensis]|uniref:NADH:ubiquinone reductase (non-electrogenic) n=1 Tax=Niastella yeongjuensis TaxID=354355 RepID=A0A1V9EQ58_9BACT|nr:NAD(P)/FAD-dependent oxidoreductase [Niastella yeongjuensis]OQP48074.1 NADH dehydrogenase [Niastella yeongjuensis]SEO25743.1 NADH dehydrogenase [Niastella yeongjuensis]